MKKSLVALAALAATSAFAQSTVTIDGRVDVSVQRVRAGAASLTSVARNGVGSSRVAFRGVEDLGGGLTAKFVIDTDVAADAPAATSLGNRESWVGLAGAFGEIRLGNDYSPYWSATGVIDPFGTNGVASGGNLFNNLYKTTTGGGAATASSTSPATGANLTNGAAAWTGYTNALAVRGSNSIGFKSPTFNGLTVALQSVQSEANPDIGGAVSYSVNYTAGPLVAVVAAISTKVSATTDYDNVLVGASYDLGVAKLSIGHVTNEYLTYKSKDTIAGLTAPVSASGTLKASYINKKVDGLANVGATQLGLGYLHALSKRTTVYGHFARTTNKSASAQGGVATAGQSVTAYQVGISHAF